MDERTKFIGRLLSGEKMAVFTIVLVVAEAVPTRTGLQVVELL